ncbi:MAG TPA: carboxypeptidase regulatory-like domain-containing protein [Methylomirabilota bacterium]|nr:carboxypeptidase regulatory-like domain-containing protein [Methylomirabilota bacterium]
MAGLRFTYFLCVVVAGALILPTPAPGGEIQGRVLLTEQAPPAKKVPVTIDQYVCGKEKDAGDLVVSAAREIRNAVVWLRNPPSGAPSAAAVRPVQMDQKECEFIPRVVLVPTGGTVEFLNSDRLLHNLHGAPKENNPFNRTQPRGRTIPITFAKPEIIRIDCDLHSWMRGWVIVTDHPFYAATDAQGRFTFGDVPPGQYTLQVWHERLGQLTSTVNVTGEGPTPVTIELRAR